MTDILKTGAIIQDHPAFEIRRAVAKQHHGLDAEYPQFRAGDILGLPFETARYGTMYHWFIFGSVASYALQYNECPIEAVAKVQERIARGETGHQLHWLNPTGSMLTAEARAKETRVALDWGDWLIFEGRIFEVTKAANNNATLREVDRKAPAAPESQPDATRIKIRHWAHMEGLDSDCSQDVQNPYNPASVDGQQWQRGRDEAMSARKGGEA